MSEVSVSLQKKLFSNIFAEIDAGYIPSWYARKNSQADIGVGRNHDHCIDWNFQTIFNQIRQVSFPFYSAPELDLRKGCRQKRKAEW